MCQKFKAASFPSSNAIYQLRKKLYSRNAIENQTCQRTIYMILFFGINHKENKNGRIIGHFKFETWSWSMDLI